MLSICFACPSLYEKIPFSANAEMLSAIASMCSSAWLSARPANRILLVKEFPPNAAVLLLHPRPSLTCPEGNDGLRARSLPYQYRNLIDNPLWHRNRTGKYLQANLHIRIDTPPLFFSESCPVHSVYTFYHLNVCFWIIHPVCHFLLSSVYHRLL